MRRSRKCCCKRLACRKIRQRAVCCTCATTTLMCSSASMASCCRTASAASAAFSIPRLIGSMSLVTGALPAQFGGRTVGIVDMTTRADAFNNSGNISYYGGSRGTIEPSFDYGGTFGGTCPPKATVAKAPPLSSAAWWADCTPRCAIFLQRTLFANHGGHRKSDCRRSTPSTISPSRQKGFGYMSTFVDQWTRLSLIPGPRQQFSDS